MPNLSYWCIFTCSIDLEGSTLDPSNDMLQIAAYLQHTYCKWQFLENYEFIPDETQDIVSLESNYTSYQISWCCSNQKCCSYLLLQPEVLQQLAAKLRKCKTETEIWKTGKSRFAANCSKFGWLFSLGSTVFHQIEKLTFSLSDADLCAVRQRQKAPLWVGGG